MAEWFTVPCLLHVAQTVMGWNPEPPPMLADMSEGARGSKGLAAMLTSMQSAGVAPEVNLRNSAQAKKHASEKSTLALKPRADVTRNPKQGYQWPPRKKLMSSKNKIKKRLQRIRVYVEYLVFKFQEYLISGNCVNLLISSAFLCSNCL